ncbi:MAG: ORF6N domain-containing protein [Ignavibacteriales bacterium]|nr:ORF6N domain-containing protein [Ignavibacteriales bacterium]
MSKSNYLSLETIETKIFIIRGQKVMLDKDLATLYDVETFNLNKAVKRNSGRFPNDFMFRLTKEEFNNLIFQFGISSWGGTRKLPYAFTEQGVAMLSSVLRSERAVQVNIQIMRAFVKLREIISTHKELAQKLKELELKIESHDENITAIFDAINQLLAPEDKPNRKIGFEVKEKTYSYKTRRR